MRIGLADDQALVRAAFRVLLENTEGFVVVGEAANGAEAIELARRARPDVLLMDIRMPVLDGVEAIRQICADPELTMVRAVALTTFELDEYVFAALRAGASGFLIKDIEPAELRRAVTVAAAGEALLSPAIAGKLIAALRTGPRQGPSVDAGRLHHLTDREREVTALVAGGLTNQDIARTLAISAATAKTHVYRAMLKLGARDRAQLVVFSYQSGLVVPPGYDWNRDAGA